MSARAALLSLLALGLFAPAAHADIFAASEGRAAGRTDLDLYVINAGTGAAVALYKDEERIRRQTSGEAFAHYLVLSGRGRLLEPVGGQRKFQASRVRPG